jgi:LuxR family transcriptional regulator, maltose regulon positive regulatory protein
MIGTSDTLVSTKLRPSQARPKLVARPRLIATLEREPGRKLTLISAPAGFGKSTLLGEWLKGREGGDQSVAWVSLDEGDNDPVRFLSYLVAALGRTVGEGFSEGILAALRSPEPPRMEAVLGALINELADLSGEVAVVLDDYHVIDSDSVHRIVTLLLERLPQGAHLVISARVDPPLPLARLRVRHQMAELHAADLRFTLAETAAFLSGAMDLELSAAAVAALEEVTEGWIAALQLAALSMREREDVSAFIRSFTGSHRDVFDFLAEEVLEKQIEGVQTFLLETSILESLSGLLCDALTGRNDGQRTLERLERQNLFVFALDDERRWYRYHHLFADFLRSRLERARPERVEELHQAAAAWCEGHGLIDNAVRHTLAADNLGWAARLIEQHVADVLARSERATLDRWLAALPPELIRYRPRLCLVQAYQVYLAGRLDELERLLDDAEWALSAEGTVESATAMPSRPSWAAGLLTNVPGAIAVLRADLARLRGYADRTSKLAQQALACLAEGDHILRTLAGWELARAHWMRGELAVAERAMSGVLTPAALVGLSLYFALVAYWDLGRVRSAQGRLRAALHTYRDALELAAGVGRSATTAVGIVHVGLAEVLREQNELHAALEHATEGIEYCRQLANRIPLASGLATLARIRQARGDQAGALEAIEEARRVGLSPEIIDLFNPVAVQQARLLLIQGDATEAALWTTERRFGVEDEPTYLREREHLVLARVLLAKGKPDQALRLLERLHEEARDRKGSVIEIMALEALALRARDERERAVNALSRTLTLAEPEGYIRTFVDEGPPMAELLSEVLEAQQRGRLDSPIPAHYLRKLLAVLERDISGAAQPATEFPEALSERELEVLQLIAAGKSNRRIATELFVSVGTVKTHINNLYRKLDAHSRTQALARARELNLI